MWIFQFWNIFWVVAAVTIPQTTAQNMATTTGEAQAQAGEEVRGEVKTLWNGDHVKQIHDDNLQLFQTEMGQKMLRMLRHFQGGDRTGPNANSPIWILEILQNAIDAGAKNLRISRQARGFVITHDNFHRVDQGITLEELRALCNVSTTTKSLTSVGFFGIGFKSIFYVFKRVGLRTVSAPGGDVYFNVGGEIPLERSDLLKAVLPTWTPILHQGKLLNTTFILSECRFGLPEVAKSVSSFLSNSSLLRSVLKVHGLENIEYSDLVDKIPIPLVTQETYIAQVSWGPSDQAYHTLQRLRDLDTPLDQTNVNNYCATVSGIIKIPLCRGEYGQATNISSKSFVFCTFPTHDLTGLQFSIDGPFLLDANRLHLRWESGCGEWNTEIIAQCLPELICQFATWLPSYLSTITDEARFRNELHEGINIILSWGNKKRKLDYGETRNIHDTLMSVFLSLTTERSALCDRLSTIPFLPLSSGSEWNQVTWISLRDIIWPADLRNSSLHSHPIADSWFVSLPNAHHLCPYLPNLEDPQMKLLYSLMSWITPDHLRYNSRFFQTLNVVDIKRWYSSFPDSRKEERKAGLLLIWKKCKEESSSLPCVPTHRIDCKSGSNPPLVFKGIDDEFFLRPTYNSPKWFSLIKQCVDLGNFEYYQVPVELNSLFDQDPSSTISFRLVRSRTTMSLDFINRLLHSVNDESRFPIALEFILAHQSSDKLFWAMDSTPTSGCFISEVVKGSILSPLPNEWLPTAALHAKYVQLTSGKERFSMDSRLCDALPEFRCSELQNSCLGSLKKMLIQETSAHTKYELLALEFASPLHSAPLCTGWGSKRGYSMRDWMLSSVGKEVKGDLLPYLLAKLPCSLLKGTFYRSSNTEFSPTGHRPSQWIREILPCLPQWRLIPSLADLCLELEAVCAKEPNLLQTSKNMTASATALLPLPPLEELRRRDEVMRHWFTHRDWVSNAEYELKRSFVSLSRSLLPEYPLLIDDEWEVCSNRTDLGRGDLLFCCRDGKKIAVVELKANSSSTTESVREQARNYATLYHERYSVEHVRGYIVRTTSLFTSDNLSAEFVCHIGSS